MKLELIVWEDITSHAGGEWASLQDIRNKDTTRFYTAGFVVQETEESIIVVGTMSSPDEDDVTVGHDTVIPKGCIVSRKVLRSEWWKSKANPSKLNQSP